MNRRLDRIKARYARLRRLYRVSQVIHSTLDPDDALALILREAVRLTGAVSGSVVLVNPTTGFLEIQAAHGLPPNADRLRLRLGEGLTGWVARNGRPARVADVLADPRYIMVRPQVRSELAVPLAVGGEIRGVINVDADRPGAFGADDQELLSELARRAAGVIRNTWLYEQLRLEARLFESLFIVGQAQAALAVDLRCLNGLPRRGAVVQPLRESRPTGGPEAQGHGRQPHPPAHGGQPGRHSDAAVNTTRPV